MKWDIDFNTIVLMLVAVANAYTVYISHRTEKNTNSMKDALVAATAKASLAQGNVEGRKAAGDAAAAAAAAAKP